MEEPRHVPLHQHQTDSQAELLHQHPTGSRVELLLQHPTGSQAELLLQLVLLLQHPITLPHLHPDQITHRSHPPDQVQPEHHVIVEEVAEAIAVVEAPGEAEAEDDDLPDFEALISL